MGVAAVAARTSELAARQWGLLTTAQAEAEGVTRLQLSRLADAGVIQRVDRGIYATPAAVDERTALRAAWLSLEPSELAERRLADPVASGVISHASAAALHEVGDLLDDEPEITVAVRKQSRRGIRLHRSALSADEVTIVAGLPVTTPARTVADLLRDGRDRSHVAEIAGDMLRRGLASRQELAVALDPLARRNGQSTGAELLEHLLDLVGLSGAALVSNLAMSDLGKALIAAGQRSAISSIADAVSKLGISKFDIPKSALGSIDSAAMAAIVKNVVLSNVDMSAIIASAGFSSHVNVGAFGDAFRTSIPPWLPSAIRSIPKELLSPSVLAITSDQDEAPA